MIRFYFPLELMELSTRYEYWKSNVHEIKPSPVNGGLHSWVSDQCDQGGGSKGGCTCVALVHGLGDNSNTWKKLLIWPRTDWNSRGFDQPLKLVAVDLPGTGESLPPKESNGTGYRARKQAERLHESLKSLSRPQGDCAKWIVVGNSFGGWVALWLSLDWPQDVERLVLLSPAGLKQKEIFSNAQTVLSAPTVESLKDFQKRAYAKPREIPEFVWKALVRRVEKGTTAQVAQAQTEEDGLDSRLFSIRTPSLMLWGKQDRVLPLSYGYQMRSLMPGGVLWREVEGCGHLPQKECPQEVVQAIIDMTRFGPM